MNVGAVYRVIFISEAQVSQLWNSLTLSECRKKYIYLESLGSEGSVLLVSVLKR